MVVTILCEDECLSKDKLQIVTVNYPEIPKNNDILFLLNFIKKGVHNKMASQEISVLNKNIDA